MIAVRIAAALGVVLVAGVEQGDALDRHELDRLASAQGADTPETRLRAGIAACLLPEPARGQAMAAFEASGWERLSWGGLAELSQGSSLLLLADDGSFCDASSEAVGRERAEALLRGVLDAAGGGWRFERTGRGCLAAQPPAGETSGLSIQVSSAGQDPVCTETGTSAVRVWRTERDGAASRGDP